MRRRVLTIITSLALAASACGGGSDEPEATQALAAPQTPVPAPTTTSPPPTTTAAPAPTTAAPPATTTTTAVPLPDGQELLMMTNEAMAQMPEFLGTGRGVVKEAIDAPDSAALVTQLAVGGGPAGGGGGGGGGGGLLAADPRQFQHSIASGFVPRTAADRGRSRLRPGPGNRRMGD